MSWFTKLLGNYETKIMKKQATTECIYKPLIGKLLLNKASSTLLASLNAQKMNIQFTHAGIHIYTNKRLQINICTKLLMRLFMSSLFINAINISPLVNMIHNKWYLLTLKECFVQHKYSAERM